MLRLIVVALVGAAIVIGFIRLAWHAVGVYRIRRAGPRRFLASAHVLWRDPGPASALDLVHGPGGRDAVPAPPFAFVQEHTSGSQPCLSVVDARGRRWRIKWGNEVNSEPFAVRLAWACGYFAETTFFLRDGIVEGARDLQRAGACVDAAGRFTNARFELDDPSVRKLFEEHSWAWDDNPFVGSHQLNALKVLVMLLSNWDIKDRRDVARGSNTAIFEHQVSAWRHEARYLISDWGGSMGRWGTNVVTRGRWDPEGFAAQTESFVLGVADGRVRFGYTGQRTADVAEDITVDDVRWLYRYLGALSDDQLRAALEASGATDEEQAKFTETLRERIAQLGRVAQGTWGADGAVPGGKR